MHTFSPLFWVPAILTLVALISLRVDLKFWQKWSLKRAELSVQDKWKELNEHFEKMLRCRRPMLLWFRRRYLPGSLQAEYALHLSNQGENERALVLAQKASLTARKRPLNYMAVVPVEAMILSRLGRYDEATEAVRRGRAMLADPALAAIVKTNPSVAAFLIQQEGMIEYNLGHLEVAINLGREAAAADLSDAARALISGALTAQGRFREALQVLAYQPSNFYDFLGGLPSLPEFQDQPALELLEKSELFRKTAEKINEEASAIFAPAVHLTQALVFLEANDAEKLGAALEQTHAKLKSNRIMEHIFVRTRACWHGMKGNRTGLEADLARTHELAAMEPSSRSAKYETHLGCGRAYFLVGDYVKAVAELQGATKHSLHPMERQVANYWLARASQAANSPSSVLFQSVV
jgi:tetratricopeptide (TPR) repeat protein